MTSCLNILFSTSFSKSANDFLSSSISLLKMNWRRESAERDRQRAADAEAALPAAERASLASLRLARQAPRTVEPAAPRASPARLAAAMDSAGLSRWPEVLMLAQVVLLYLLTTQLAKIQSQLKLVLTSAAVASATCAPAPQRRW